MHGGPLLHQQAFLQSADLLVKAAMQHYTCSNSIRGFVLPFHI